MVCTLINDARHHSGQNTVDSQGAKKMLFSECELKKDCVHTLTWAALSNQVVRLVVTLIKNNPISNKFEWSN